MSREGWTQRRADKYNPCPVTEEVANIYVDAVAEIVSRILSMYPENRGGAIENLPRNDGQSWYKDAIKWAKTLTSTPELQSFAFWYIRTL